MRGIYSRRSEGRKVSSGFTKHRLDVKRQRHFNEVIGRDIVGRQRRPAFSQCAAEVFIQGIETVGFNFAENAAQLLFHTVYGVEESAAIDVHLPAAEFPVRSHQEMEAEGIVLEIGECTAA